MANNFVRMTEEEKLLVKGKPAKDFVGHRKIFFILSLAIIGIGLICNFIFGTTLDIQFTGGSMIKYSYTETKDFKLDELKSLVQKATPDDVVTFSDSKDMVNDKNVLTVQFSGTNTITTKLQKSITKQIQEKFPDNKFVLEQNSSVHLDMTLLYVLDACNAPQRHTLSAAGGAKYSYALGIACDRDIKLEVAYSVVNICVKLFH